MSQARSLPPKSPTTYFVFEQLATGGWQLKTVELAPDASTACEYYLGGLLLTLRHSDAGSGSRDLKNLGVSTDPLGCLFGHSIPERSSDRFVFLYRGW